MLPTQVKIVEMAARDGLQNEPCHLSAIQKADFIKALASCGFAQIEVGSFVSPKAIPQMANTDEVLKLIEDVSCTKSVLTPNLKGMQAALEARADEVAVFAAASEKFTQNNLNCSIDQSVQRFEDVCTLANEKNIAIRGYVSCIFKCPWGDKTEPALVLELCQKLLDMGCYEISLGDTTGHGNPQDCAALMDYLTKHIPAEKLAVHFHDTYGMAIANLMPALEAGIATIDSSAGGLGGCPYANGASGNVATEDVIWLLDQLGIKHGIDLNKLVQITDRFLSSINRPCHSNVHQAILKRS